MKNDKLKSGKKLHHENRNDLGPEFPFWDLIQIIIFIIFSVVWIADSFIFHFPMVFTDYIPAYIRISFFIILFILLGYLGLISHKIVFKEVRNPPVVIEKNVFKLVRHPMYLACLIFYLGLIILTLSVASFIFFIIIIIIFNHAAGYEENKLKEKFGKEYVSYMERIPRWIPNIKKK